MAHGMIEFLIRNEYGVRTREKRVKQKGGIQMKRGAVLQWMQKTG